MSEKRAIVTLKLEIEMLVNQKEINWRVLSVVERELWSAQIRFKTIELHALEHIESLLEGTHK